MAYTSWPTGSDVAAFLKAMDVDIDAAEAQALADAAVEAWNDATGYHPFLSSGASETVTYDPPGTSGIPAILDLRGGFVSISAVAVDGAAQTAGTDYYPLPSGRVPITSLAFRTSVYGEPGSISVTGVKGYSATLSASDWLAVRGHAAAMAVQIQSAAGGVRRVKAGPVETEFDTTAGRDSVTRWMDTFKKAAARYRAAGF